MKRKWIEISCDYCGCACHYSPGNVDTQARKDGWIITHDGKHFDCKDCLKNYKYKEDYNTRKDRNCDYQDHNKIDEPQINPKVLEK